MNAAGRPPGMYMADTGFRREEEKDSARRVEGPGRARQPAIACPQARVVTVCDREGDFRELLSDAGTTGAALLVRASRGTRRRVAAAPGESTDLFGHVPETQTPGRRKIAVPARGGPNRRKGRTAKLTLRCVPVDLMPPQDRAGEAPLRMIAVSAREEGRPRRAAAGRRKAPADRMLPTTGGQADLETARMAVR